MPFYVGNGSISGGNSAFAIRDNSANVVFQQGISKYNGSNFGYLLQQGVPGFIAAPLTDPGSWVNYASGTWSKTSGAFNNTAYNNGNYYDKVNTRFNVPFTGPYLFISTHYMYTDGYMHPLFAVNGSTTTRRGGNTFYRLRGHGMVANYNQDLQIEEVIYENFYLLDGKADLNFLESQIINWTYFDKNDDDERVFFMTYRSEEHTSELQSH